ncbi:MAG TPA: NAD-dependent epimerase/dehydratase family protein [Mycobacteriales bacterium]|nr:NAD-dependent epimerase/dehydratase family protein [Mycobacteriales bacterium]
MRLLVLGGSQFVGRAVVEEALARGADVTTVSRGASGEPPAGVTWLPADRTEPAQLQAALRDGSWDAVIDTWSGESAAVEAAAKLLADVAGWYGYVSSRSVYRWPLPVGADESAAVVEVTPAGGYASDKRASELAVLEHFADRSVIGRASLVLGPHENVGRLTWWLERAAAGGIVVAPDPPDRGWQQIDARDLATFLLDAASAATSGVFNLVSPRSDGTTTERLLTACIDVTGRRADPVWTPVDVLEQAGIKPWDDLPGWVPAEGEYAGLHDCDVTAAVAVGLECRPIEATVADTWAWMQSLEPPGRPPRRSGLPRRGLSAEQEQAVWWLLGAQTR